MRLSSSARSVPLLLLGLIVLVGCLVAASTTSDAGPAGASGAPIAQTVTSIPTVGPLFVVSTGGPVLRLPHYCSASVVHSTGHDLVLTAAHCIAGTGAGLQFAPGYHDGVSPYGVWSVLRVYVDPAWVHGQDPQRDVAVLKLTRNNGSAVEDSTGASAELGSAPPSGTLVTVDGYVAGRGGRPVTCTAPVYYRAGYPAFDCDGYSDGVSGGPWLSSGKVVGVIGGLNQGGCDPAISYTSAFGPATARLVARAESGDRGDFVPAAGSSGC